MSERSDLGNVLRVWLEDGPSTMPDRVVDVVADRIHRQPQRRGWRLRWRLTPMNTQLKVAGGLIAAVIVAIAAWQLLPRSGGIGSQPTPSPVAATPSPAPASAASLPEGSVAAGRYSFNPLASAPNLRVEADVPAGWQGFGEWSILGPSGTGAPAGIGIGFIAADGIFSDPCHWDLAGDRSWPQPADVAVGPTVDDLVTALVANDSYTTTTPSDVSLGGADGKRVELQLPSGIGACDDDGSGGSRYMVFSGIDGGLYAQGPDNRMQLSIVDVEGTRLIISVGYYPGTPAAERTAAEVILQSLAITR